MVRRILVPEGALAEGVSTLDPDVAVHVRDVLRLGAGDALLLRDGAGHEADATIEGVSKRVVSVRVGGVRVIDDPSSRVALTLVQAVGKGDKMDSVVRQASELGARVIVPVVTARAVARQEGRVDRWRGIAHDATRVSGRALRPRIEPVARFEDVLARPRSALALCLAGGAPRSLAAELDARASSDRPATIEVLIGPEGGLTDPEIAAAIGAGFSAVHLGPHTLRTETAGPAVLAIVLFWAGALAR
ncbi:16S rRNA (uracil(1498)-N(3))-methyltransferase [Myxococcota bacterium]|nr:16S rRNA (uracil(1498)-N(3))-methyltransferase [Myxococcota bacterium]